MRARVSIAHQNQFTTPPDAYELKLLSVPEIFDSETDFTPTV
jgi:hypothetical protein